MFFFVSKNKFLISINIPPELSGIKKITCANRAKTMLTNRCKILVKYIYRQVDICKETHVPYIWYDHIHILRGGDDIFHANVQCFMCYFKKSINETSRCIPFVEFGVDVPRYTSYFSHRQFNAPYAPLSTLMCWPIDINKLYFLKMLK